MYYRNEPWVILEQVRIKKQNGIEIPSQYQEKSLPRVLAGPEELKNKFVFIDEYAVKTIKEFMVGDEEHIISAIPIDSIIGWEE